MHARRMSEAYLTRWSVFVGLGFCWSVLAFSGCQYLISRDMGRNLAVVAADFFGSPAMVSAMFTMLWTERAVHLARWSSAENVPTDETSMSTGMIWRLRQWISGILAWGAGASAVALVFSWSTTLILLAALVAFGMPMWNAERIFYGAGDRDNGA